jgi:hypothetical protein
MSFTQGHALLIGVGTHQHGPRPNVPITAADRALTLLGKPGAGTTGALLLLHGLDECGSSTARERALSAVNAIMRTAEPKCRFLLTARPYAWPGGPDPEQGGREGGGDDHPIRGPGGRDQ